MPASRWDRPVCGTGRIRGLQFNIWGDFLIHFPTSNDIYIEIDGRKLAVAQGYRTKAARESRYVEAFGSSEPVGAVGGRFTHVLELERIYVSAQALGDGIDFYALSGFSVVIVKPDRRVIYTGCEWSSIDERAELGSTVFERVTIAATSRMELI